MIGYVFKAAAQKFVMNLMTEEEAVDKVTSAPTYAVSRAARPSSNDSLGDGSSLSSTPAKGSRASDAGSGSGSGSIRRQAQAHSQRPSTVPMERITEEVEKESVEDDDEEDDSSSEDESQPAKLVMSYKPMVVCLIGQLLLQSCSSARWQAEKPTLSFYRGGRRNILDRQCFLKVIC
jgi:cobalamin biosynthesis Mg chelatase CobN